MKAERATIGTIIVFGALGDLAVRELYPSLALLLARGVISDTVRVIGCDRRVATVEEFRSSIIRSGRASANAKELEGPCRDLARLASYVELDLEISATQPDAASQKIHGLLHGPFVMYLAIPPSLFGDGIEIFRQLTPSDDCRLVIEKPFGIDQTSAERLNALIEPIEHLSYRADLVLGLPALWRVLSCRGQAQTRAIWNSEWIRRIDLLWDEDIAIGGRGQYYDHIGAVGDVIQSHLMELLYTTTMHLPDRYDVDAIRRLRTDAARAVQTFDVEGDPPQAIRARYTHGTLRSGAKRDVPDYVVERRVEPVHRTETYAEVALRVGDRVWSGTQFVLRAGKALAQRRKGALVQFRRAIPVGVLPDDVLDSSRSIAWFDLDIPIRRSMLSVDWVPQVFFDTRLSDIDWPYCFILSDVLASESALDLDRAEPEEAWRVLDPVHGVWRAGGVPLMEYRGGSSGPSEHL